jgi:hypothetical protein
VKRDRQSELLGLLGQSANAGDEAAGRDRQMARPDAESGVGVHEPQRAQARVVVGERLALAHCDRIGDAPTEVASDEADLVDHLSGAEVARQTADPCRTEGAAHRAPGLRRKAHGEPIAAREPDRLDGGAARETHKVLASPVSRLLALQNLGGGQRQPARQGFSQAGWEVCHLGKGADSSLVEPALDLPGAKTRLAKVTDECLESGSVERFDADKAGVGCHRYWSSSSSAARYPLLCSPS